MKNKCPIVYCDSCIHFTMKENGVCQCTATPNCPIEIKWFQYARTTCYEPKEEEIEIIDFDDICED